MPPNGRILFLSLSLSSLTSNLQSLICIHEDINYIRSDIETWIGFRLGTSRDNPQLGQITINEVGWSFYELGKLKRCIAGQDQDARYETLIRVLFCIQKCKQEYVIRSKLPG